MIVFSSSISALINFLLNLIVIAVFMFINHVPATETVILLPLILIEVYIFGLGISLFLSAAYVKYRDVNYIWEVVLQAGFYMTPILYPVTLITNLTLQKLILINPLAQAIQDARYVTVTHQAVTTYKVFNGGWYFLVPFIIVAAVISIGIRYFAKESKSFAENI